jgi:diadenosine tetraphosphate (Ap4A) HIT family hydrolase
MKYEIKNTFLDNNGKIKMMPRAEYDEFLKNTLKDVCFFCEYKEYQRVIKEWEHWMLLQPVSPYFENHIMLCPKRHVLRLHNLNDDEKKEFWDIDGKINIAYKKACISRLRMQLHIRDKHTKSGEHLHIHYYEFKEGDFAFMLPEDAYLQDMDKKIGDYL